MSRVESANTIRENSFANFAVFARKNFQSVPTAAGRLENAVEPLQVLISKRTRQPHAFQEPADNLAVPSAFMQKRFPLMAIHPFLFKGDPVAMDCHLGFAEQTFQREGRRA